MARQRTQAPPWLPIYRSTAIEAAALYEIPLARLLATIEQESAGDPRAYRYEPAFWTRYLADRDDYSCPGPAASLEHWKRRVSASYGLCQIMFATARDHGLPPECDPEALYQPRVNLTLAAKILRRAVNATKGDWRAAHLRYNGGGRPAYADEIEARLPRFEALA